METPEFISGIPTDKHASAQRRTIIKTEYIKLIEKLQNQNGKKAVFNEFLQTDTFHSSECEHLNFTVKLVMGIKSDGRHVQYSVNKIVLI